MRLVYIKYLVKNKKLCYNTYMKIITENREAKHNYFLDNFIEAGVVLEGSEVKSARAGRVNLKDSYVVIRGGEVFLLNCFFSPFEKATMFAPDERRTRKLLLNKQEIAKLEKKVKEQGLTIVPTKMYFKENLVKVEIALAKGKHLYDKRQDMKKADLKRDIERAIKG